MIATGAGALSQRSLGAVIFGGLLVATVLRPVGPSFYVLMKNLEANWFPASQASQLGNGENAPDPDAAA